MRKRADLIYRIMVKRGFVIPEFDEVMSQPDDITPEEAEMLEKQIEAGSAPAEVSPEALSPVEEPPKEEAIPPVEIPEIPGVTVPANP